jgi:chromosome segregation ATPase
MSELLSLVPGWIKIAFGGGGLVGVVTLLWKIFTEGSDRVKKYFRGRRKAEVEESRIESEHELGLLNQLRQELKEVRKEQDELRSTVEQYRKDYYELKVENESIRRENEKIRRENTELKHSNERLERNNKRLQKIVYVLKARLDKFVDMFLQENDISDVPEDMLAVAQKEDVEDILEDEEIAAPEFEDGQFAQPDS